MPPHWSNRDWSEEMAAEAVVAALQAARDFDPSRGIPREAFLYQRVMHSALARYRREWSYALRRGFIAALDEWGMVEGAAPPAHEAIHKLLQDALERLPHADAWLIESLFWEGRTEAGLGEVLGITQQAVSKRKKGIFKKLRQLVDTFAATQDHDYEMINFNLF